MALGAPLALLVLLATAAGPPAASADSIPIRVDFDAPAGCSSAAAFYDGVAARSERVRRASPGETGVRFGVRLWRSGTRVHGELRLVDGQNGVDTRRVEGAGCDEVVGVLSLTAALAIDPAARMGPAPGPRAVAGSGESGASGNSDGGGARAPSDAAAAGPAAAAPSPPPPPPPPAPPPPPSPPPERVQAAIGRVAEPPAEERAGHRDRALRFGLGAQAMVARVLAPTVAVGGGISLRLIRERSDAAPRSAELTAMYLGNDPFRSSDEVVARWAAVAVTVCPGWGFPGPHLSLDLCAQAVGGWLRVTDRAVTNPASAGRFWGTVGAMARFGMPVGRGFSLEAELALGIPLMERRFITTTPEKTVGDTPAVAAAGSIGVARRF